jgi:SAM-dependent methyltransferase
MNPSTRTRPYVLGADDNEQSRLDLQAAYYRMATLDALHWAGLREGMSVLDLGSGTGAVTLDAARLVGPSGSVVGVDASAEAVAAARSRATEAGLDNVRFEQADLDHWAPDRHFDLLTGRLISMYLPDPAATVRRLSEALRPGGVVLLQEFVMSACRQLPETPLFGQTMQRVLAAFAAVGAPTDLGYALGAVLRGAGLEQPTMTLAGRYEDGPDAVAYALLVGITRTLAPAIIGHRLATAAELDLDTLEERLRTAGGQARAGAVPPLLVSAWARVPAL